MHPIYFVCACKLKINAAYSSFNKNQNILLEYINTTYQFCRNLGKFMVRFFQIRENFIHAATKSEDSILSIIRFVLSASQNGSSGLILKCVNSISLLYITTTVQKMTVKRFEYENQTDTLTNRRTAVKHFSMNEC